MPGKPSPDEAKISAIGAELYAKLSAELTRQGLPAHAITVAEAYRCGLENRE